jgi:hypothetical protein
MFVVIVLNILGIDFAKYKADDLSFDISGLRQEVIVNKGLKDLVVSAFLPAWRQVTASRL